MKKYLIIIIAVFLITGCATVKSLSPNSYIFKSDMYGIGGCHIYKDYEIEIVSDPPGAKIEWNNEYLGTTPLHKTFNGEVGILVTTIVKAYPIYPGQYVQTKIIYGNQPYPHRIYFNMDLMPPSNDINVNIN